MAKLGFLLAFVIFLSAGNKKTFLINSFPGSDTLDQDRCLSQLQAERILGKPSRFLEGNSRMDNGVQRYECTYSAGGDRVGEVSNLYYLKEVYSTGELAHRTFSRILKGNGNMPGQQPVHALGEEAWLHHDNNFHLIIVRKGSKMIRIKVNKVTSVTSLKELQKVAGEIISKL